MSDQRQLTQCTTLDSSSKDNTLSKCRNAVIHILAGTEGFCDDIETTEVNNFIADLTAHFEKNESALLKEIVERGTLKKEGLRARVTDVIKSFRASWN